VHAPPGVSHLWEMVSVPRYDPALVVLKQTA
jgi:hypothetical protein